MPWPQCGYKNEKKVLFFTVFMSVCGKRYLLKKTVTTTKGAIFDLKIVKMFP